MLCVFHISMFGNGGSCPRVLPCPFWSAHLLFWGFPLKRY